MFLLSNYILREVHVDKPKNLLALYSIAIGLIVYVSVYLYVLYYHKEQLPLFNNLLIYVLSLDLLLSGALYNQSNENFKNDNGDETDFQSEVHSLSESLSEDDCTSDEEQEQEQEQEQLEIEVKLEEPVQDEVETKDEDEDEDEEEKKTE